MQKWFQELKEFLEDSKKLTGMERLKHIWTYYWIPIVSVVLAVSFLIFAVHRFFFVPKDNWFFALYANTSAEAGEGSDIWDDFVAYGDFDLDEKNVYFNSDSYFVPGTIATSEGAEYYNMFVAYVDAGTLDVVLMPKEDLQELGQYGRLADLDLEEFSELQQYSDLFIYAVPEDTETYGTDPIPIGIDLSNSRLVNEYQIYSGDCALGVGIYTEHLDVVLMFLEFITEGGTAQ